VHSHSLMQRKRGGW